MPQTKDTNQSAPSAGDVCVIPLTHGKVTLVDMTDADMLLAHRWRAARDKSGLWYAVRAGYNETGKYTLIRMHRVLMRPPDGLLVDHINHDGLDNRRSNLRVVTPAQNARNRRVTHLGSSKYKGVCRIPNPPKWQAGIQVDGKSIHLGWFETELEAALAYDVAAVKYFGEYAHINFPTSPSE